MIFQFWDTPIGKGEKKNADDFKVIDLVGHM